MVSTLGRIVRRGAWALGGILLASGQALAAWELDMPVGKSILADEIMGLHHLILLICTVICVALFGFAFFVMFKYRRSKGAKAVRITHSTLAETIWTTIPTLILIFMAIPSARTIIAIEDTSSPDITIKITGYQWKWSYDYLDEDMFFFSTIDRASNAAAQKNSGIDPGTVDNYLRNVDKPMVVPVNQRIRLLLTANDVIHSWWVPELYVKKDANPGFINEAWFEATETGIFRGQCTELCGRGHGFMPVVVVVETERNYERWLAGELEWDEQVQQLIASNQNDAEAALAVAQIDSDKRIVQ
jgi:cytochrome c oxidase subunit 2